MKYTPPHIDGKSIDIWAMGVTLYCLIFGRVPFSATTEFELLSVICHKELTFPEDIPISDSLRDLFTKILNKDPKKRLSIKEIEQHPWVTEDMLPEEKEEWLQFINLDMEPLHVTEDEVKKALTLKERIKRKISKISHSFNNFITDEFKRKTKSMTSVNAHAKDNEDDNQQTVIMKRNTITGIRPNNISQIQTLAQKQKMNTLERERNRCNNSKEDEEEEEENNIMKEENENTDDTDLNEDSSGDFLYMSFDKKKLKQRENELDKSNPKIKEAKENVE